MERFVLKVVVLEFWLNDRLYDLHLVSCRSVVSQVRNVKWVTEVHACKEEATGMWQRGMAYKMLPSSVSDAQDSVLCFGNAMRAASLNQHG